MGDIMRIYNGGGIKQES
jgi:hypothetical protein